MIAWSFVQSVLCRAVSFQGRIERIRGGNFGTLSKSFALANLTNLTALDQLKLEAEERFLLKGYVQMRALLQKNYYYYGS